MGDYTAIRLMGPAYVGRLMLAAFLFAASCAYAKDEKIPAPGSAVAERVSSATAEFGFRLLRALGDNPGQNTIISPFGISAALAMAYNGASGTTKDEMAKALALGSLRDDDIDQANRYLIHALTNADPKVEREIASKLWPKVELEIANALWVQKDFPINPEFTRVCETFFDARAASLDFAGNPSGAAAEINSWVDKSTHDRIPEIVSNIDPQTRLILTDAVYFKAAWGSPFEKEETRPRDFHLFNGSSKQVPMMNKKSELFSYLENTDFQAIHLPYGRGHYEMYLFLPRKVSGLPDFLRSLNAKRWKQWTKEFQARPGNIALPKFETRFSGDLNDALEKIGMKSAFDPLHADFSGIPLNREKGLYIKKVEHKTWVKVDEAGTEAAAATAVIAEFTSAFTSPKGPFVMVVDHPFFFAISEAQSGAILFAGVVTDPTIKGGD